MIPCNLLPPHLAEICCGNSPRFTALQCVAHTNSWRIGKNLEKLSSEEVQVLTEAINAKRAFSKTTPIDSVPVERVVIPPTKYLGDHIESALSSVGVTKQAVEQFLGAPCNCAERQEKFNQLDKWARAVVSGAVGNAKGFLEKIFRGETKMPTGN